MSEKDLPERLQLQNERIYVVTGVNLPMLLEVGMQKN